MSKSLFKFASRASPFYSLSFLADFEEQKSGRKWSPMRPVFSTTAGAKTT